MFCSTNTHSCRQSYWRGCHYLYWACSVSSLCFLAGSASCSVSPWAPLLSSGSCKRQLVRSTDIGNGDGLVHVEIWLIIIVFWCFLQSSSVHWFMMRFGCCSYLFLSCVCLWWVGWNCALKRQSTSVKFRPGKAPAREIWPGWEIPKPLGTELAKLKSYKKGVQASVPILG